MQANKQPSAGRAAEATIHRAKVPQALNRGMVQLSRVARLENVDLYYPASIIFL